MNSTDKDIKAEQDANHPDKKENEVTPLPVTSEVDEDELVHDLATDTPDMTEEQDLDELSHTIPPAENIKTQEQDIDDLLHQTPPQQDSEDNF